MIKLKVEVYQIDSIYIFFLTTTHSENPQCVYQTFSSGINAEMKLTKVETILPWLP